MWSLNFSNSWKRVVLLPSVQSCRAAAFFTYIEVTYETTYTPDVKDTAPDTEMP